MHSSDKESNCRRNTDKLSNKISSAATLVLAISAIGTAVIFIASFFFQTIQKAEACDQKVQEKFVVIETKVNETDNTLVEMKNDIQWIKQGIGEIKSKLK